MELFLSLTLAKWKDLIYKEQLLLSNMFNTLNARGLFLSLFTPFLKLLVMKNIILLKRRLHNFHLFFLILHFRKGNSLLIGHPLTHMRSKLLDCLTGGVHTSVTSAYTYKIQVQHFCSFYLLKFYRRNPSELLLRNIRPKGLVWSQV